MVGGGARCGLQEDGGWGMGMRDRDEGGSWIMVGTRPRRREGKSGRARDERYYIILKRFRKKLQWKVNKRPPCLVGCRKK